MSGFLLEQRRLARFRRLPDCPLRDYFAWPLPQPSRDYRSVEYVAVDLETTGLDARKDQILSIGWVVVAGQRIRLGTARHRLLRVEGAIPAESAVIHQITDDEAATGLDLAHVLPELLWELSGRVLIAHHARIELGFLSAACKQLWGVGLLIRAVDTQSVARRLLERRQIPFKGSDLRLHALCERYNLPRHGAHNALSDALSAAELFLAQAAYRDSGHGMKLGDFL
ncbi:exonuclease domain-containing protein [uncultured Thiohalocapsa sp.]|uniref:exonuclease domain-containing protein n=1 Tax=uncultured Thiohalocapsa sp. TaxID=768990 RepID=UPI0025F6000C|nr:exonuclease domain-containing protein [uncultured Thiohalocapsa sp.]